MEFPDQPEALSPCKAESDAARNSFKRTTPLNFVLFGECNGSIAELRPFRQLDSAFFAEIFCERLGWLQLVLDPYAVVM